MNMNISTGGPHILFFERDTSLMALLISEFQLAGYECHTARTAVEVFDAIARHPIRVLLVNLAQAAAGRREFWVALDTQRRGRGVQVFTYQCYNLAGYGPREVDERSSSVAVDMEIDGMLGLMNLVERIRERIPTASATTGTVPRFSRTSSPATSSYPLSSSQTAPSTGINATSYRSNTQAQEPAIGNSGVTLHPATQTTGTGATTNGAQQSYTEKIRAVLYSDSRPVYNHAPTTEPVNGPGTVQQLQTGLDATQQLAYGQTRQESSLAQLSRMLQELQPAITPEETNVSFAQQSLDATEAISSQPLRASPIEDLPVDRKSNGVVTSEDMRYSDSGTRNGSRADGYGSHQETATTVPLASIANPMPTAQPVQSTPIAPSRPTVPIPAVSMTTPMPTVGASTATRTQEPRKEQLERVDVSETRPSPSREQQVSTTPVQPLPREVQHVEKTTSTSSTEGIVHASYEDDTHNRERVKQLVQQEEHRDDVEQRQEGARIPSQEMALADIIQSLPASPVSSSTSPQPQVLHGQPMRSLGSVLLEGHLVPQSRLEVAQNIQRMLRGVDLRYELGEILLMFKLLTPDQLLAATLVSNGLISTQQIAALGRIRQELHVIGLEYDLESLIILFRMLTPEQLREARASWQS